MDYKSTVRAPIFGRHQFFSTSEHYGKAHGSLLSGWMKYNYTACWWFPTSPNILILPSLFWQIRFESYWLHCSKCRILVLLGYNYFSISLWRPNLIWSSCHEKWGFCKACRLAWFKSRFKSWFKSPHNFFFSDLNHLIDLCVMEKNVSGVLCIMLKKIQKSWNNGKLINFCPGSHMKTQNYFDDLFCRHIHAHLNPNHIRLHMIPCASVTDE